MSLTVFHGGTVAVANGCTSGGIGNNQALAVRNGRVAAIGAAALDLLPEADNIVDLEGGYLSPSFADGHAHPLAGGLERFGPQIRVCRSVTEIQSEVKRWADRNPDTGWIIGASYNATLAEGGLFDAAWLDEAVPDRPVVLRSWDYHTVWVNSAALAAAGIDHSTPQPVGGRILKRGDGSPLGTLQEAGAVDLIFEAAGDFTESQRIQALDLASRSYAAAGVTWVQDAMVEMEDVATYVSALRQGALHTRMNLAFRADPRTWPQQAGPFVRARADVGNEKSPMLTARTVKFFLDGILENHTASLLENYADQPGQTGLPVWTPESLNEAAAFFDDRGFQLHMHAIGDAAVRTALDAIDFVNRTNGPKDRRPVIAHVQIVDPEDIERFASLGVVANFEPLWACADDAMNLLTIPRLGASRAARQYPIASLLRAGVHVSFGSDWPVTGHEPLPGIATAVTRQTPDGLPVEGWIPNERVDVEASLAAYTAGVAYQAFAENQWGSISPRMSADLVWLSHDPRTLPAPDLTEIKIRGTWLAGNQTYAASLNRPTTDDRSLAIS